MLNPSLRCILGLAVALLCASPAMAQQGSDPLTRFLDGVFKRNPPPAAPIRAPDPEPLAPQASQSSPKAEARPTPAAPKPQQTQQRPVPKPVTAQPKPEPSSQSKPKPDSRPADTAKPAVAEPPKAAAEASATERPSAEPAAAPKPARPTPALAAPAPTPVAAPAPQVPAPAPLPNSPGAAIDRVNAYFNSIEQLTAYFVQNSPNNQRSEGTLSVRRPGQLQFAYAPPSTLEIVSDGRNVAIRDKKLGTNDVYPVGQTPLKFLLQENVDLTRDTKVRDVQVGRDGVIVIRFDDSATLGGTSKITLRFDARANALKQWTIVDAQGYETSVTLSDLNVVHRRGARAGN